MKSQVKVKVKVSDLTRYLICPRLVYFNAKEHHEGMAKGKERGFIESILLKELAFNLHKFYGERKVDGPEPEPESEMEEEHAEWVIEDIVDGVERIYKEELKGVEKDFFEEVKKDFIRNLSMSTKMENDDWLEKVRTENGLLELENAYGYEREHAMFSEKLSMSGSVDKLIRTEEEVIPCMIKTGKCPEYSVWKSDRVQLAAYAMLIEEEFGFENTVKRGCVEYIRNAKYRETQISRRARRLAIETRT